MVYIKAQKSRAYFKRYQVKFKRRRANLADPSAKKSEKQPAKEHKRYNLKKLTYEERKNKLIARLQALNSAAGDKDDDEDEE